MVIFCFKREQKRIRKPVERFANGALIGTERSFAHKEKIWVRVERFEKAQGIFGRELRFSVQALQGLRRWNPDFISLKSKYVFSTYGNEILPYSFQLTCAKCSKQVNFEHSTTFPVFCYPRFNLFGWCFSNQNPNKWIFAKNMIKFICLNVKYPL